MSEGRPVGAQIHYELRLHQGAFSLVVESVLHEFPSGGTVIVRIVTTGALKVTEEIVGVLGEYEIVKVLEFMRQGGCLRLGPGLRL